MIVYFDYQCFFQKVGGVSRCFCELINNMPNIIQCKILIKVSENLYLHNLQFLPQNSYKYFTCDNYCHFNFKGKHRLFDLLDKYCPFFPTCRRINQKYTKTELQNGNFDLLHITLYDDTNILNYLKTKPFVNTVHDMIWELFPDKNNQRWSQNKFLFCQKAEHIIVVSNNTKRDLINIWNIPENKISVIYHGAPNIKNHIYKNIVNKPYFLFVGQRKGYKNFKQTLYDFARFNKSHPNISLICTGNQFNKEEQKIIDSLSLTDKVQNMFVSDDNLYNLYHFAVAFIFPSIYEGFGIPILEAFINECPTLLNETSCFPEIGGDAAIYFHSNLTGESNLCEKMEYIYSLSENDRRMLIDKGTHRAKMFSWKDSAQKLSEVYLNIANNRKHS